MNRAARAARQPLCRGFGSRRENGFRGFEQDAHGIRGQVTPLDSYAVACCSRDMGRDPLRAAADDRVVLQDQFHMDSCPQRQGSRGFHESPADTDVQHLPKQGLARPYDQADGDLERNTSTPTVLHDEDSMLRSGADGAPGVDGLLEIQDTPHSQQAARVTAGSSCRRDRNRRYG